VADLIGGDHHSLLESRVEHTRNDDQAIRARKGEYARPTGAGVNANRRLLGSAKARHQRHSHSRQREASSEYLGEFEYRWNMRQVPHLMLDRLMFSFVR
jgi:hypothetical protein